VNRDAEAHWHRALEDYAVAGRILRFSPRNAVGRAYYAVFHAVTALLALDGQSFRKHSALQAAVHRDLVRPGRWPADVGSAFNLLAELRSVSDDDIEQEIDQTTAENALREARVILEQVQ
jgi:uncharacterized protein (UPF0332 family)